MPVSPKAIRAGRLGIGREAHVVSDEHLVPADDQHQRRLHARCPLINNIDTTPRSIPGCDVGHSPPFNPDSWLTAAVDARCSFGAGGWEASRHHAGDELSRGQRRRDDRVRERQRLAAGLRVREGGAPATVRSKF